MPNLLPSRYIIASCLGGTNIYFDTGVYPTNDTNVEGIFYVTDEDNSYLFGARNSNSNSSAGQFNVLIDSTSYLGFASARTSLGSLGNTFGEIFITNEGNEFIMNFRNDLLIEKTGSTSTFTGTQTMYILAMNNGGSVNYGSDPNCYVFRFAITQGGTKIKDYYPVYDTQTSQFGLYDFVNDAFLTASGTGSFNTSYLWEVKSGTGGRAYIEMPFGDVTKMYMTPNRPGAGWRLYSPIKAVADEGYAFLNWTDQDGNIYSTDDELSNGLGITQDMILTANFVKKTDDKQINPYQLLGLAYGLPAGATAGKLNDLFTLVESFTINEDSLNKTTSTIVCREIPSAFQTDMPVLLYDTFGKRLWIGLIETIDGNILTCREPLAVHDTEFLFTPTNSIGGKNLANYTIVGGLNRYVVNKNKLPTSDTNIIDNYQWNPFTQRHDLAIGRLYDDQILSYEKSGNVFVSMPEITDRSIGNLEEYLFEIFNQFGLGIYETFFINSISHMVSIYMDIPLKYNTLVLGDNNDFISNINVTSEVQEDTVLIIFNEAGTSVRGQYGMKKDGTIGKITHAGINNPDNLEFVAWDNCKVKLVMSDDKVNTLAVQHLTNSMYNHKITFDIDLHNRMVKLDDFKMGRRVDFHIGDKMYHSIVTGRSYSLAENEKEIHRATITLGNVRTSLTSKLNLGMVK